VIPARVTVATLAARDLKRQRDFYVGLGWELMAETDDFCAFGTRGAVFTLYAATSVARDTGIEQREPSGFTFSANVDEKEEVDVAFAAAIEAGGRIVKEPVEYDFGVRSGYFADPEDNLWEVAWVSPENQMAQAIRRAAA